MVLMGVVISDFKMQYHCLKSHASLAYIHLGSRNIFILESVEHTQMQPIIHMVVWQTTAAAPGTCGDTR